MTFAEYHKKELDKFIEYECSTGWYLSMPDWLMPIWLLDLLAKRVVRRTQKKYEKYCQFKALEQQLQEIARQ